MATLQVPTTGLFKPDIRLSRTCLLLVPSRRTQIDRPGSKSQSPCSPRWWPRGAMGTPWH